MKLKKIMAVLMVASVAVSLAGCGGSSSSDSSSDSASSDSGKVYKIGICQQLEHEALDQATQRVKKNSEKTMLHLTFRMDRVSRQTVQPLRIALLRIMWI